jgi:hypothetical protein
MLPIFFQIPRRETIRTLLFELVRILHQSPLYQNHLSGDSLIPVPTLVLWAPRRLPGSFLFLPVVAACDDGDELDQEAQEPEGSQENSDELFAAFLELGEGEVTSSSIERKKSSLVIPPVSEGRADDDELHPFVEGLSPIIMDSFPGDLGGVTPRRIRLPRG